MNLIGFHFILAAGIPDFRSPDSGIFAKLRKYKLRSPECVFEINYFKVFNTIAFESLKFTKLFGLLIHSVFYVNQTERSKTVL